MPSRADFDPVQVPRHILPNLVLLEPRRQPDTSQLRLWLRLVGSGLVAAYKREITGHFLDEVYIADDYGDALRQFEITLETGRATCMWAETQTRDGRFMNYERILLPLAGNGRDIDMVLAVVHFLPVNNRFEINYRKPSALAARLAVADT